MGNKDVTLNLVDFRKFDLHHNEGQDFRIEKIKNSIEWKAGGWLTEKEVARIIRRNHMTVIIRETKDADHANKF